MSRPALAFVDAALAEARAATMRRLASQRESAAYYRKLIAGKLTPHRSLAQRRARHDEIASACGELRDRRELMADTPLSFEWSPETQARFDDYYDEIETRLQRECRHAAVRELNAEACSQAAAYLFAHPTPPRPKIEGHIGRGKELQPLRSRDLLLMAEKLRRARRAGHWGIHTETAARHIRFFDRSGLPLLDPSEARRSGARIARRIVPLLQRCHAAGLLLYYAVASEPNMPAGQLEWGKRNLYRRLRRDMYRHFPEIVGLLACQEDPLAADRQSWNVHINLVLVVDPKRCTPLTEAFAQQLEINLPGELGKLPAVPARDHTPPGKLSFAKVHHVWGAHQFHIQPLRSADPESLGRTLREVIKYSVKMASAKSIAERTGSGVGADDPTRRRRSTDRDNDVGPLGAGRAADCAVSDHGPALPLGEGEPENKARFDPAVAPPGLAQYPPGRFVELLEANRRFRRVRTWGLLYRLAADDLPPDPDKAGKIRWCGRVSVSPRHVYVAAARLRFISSIHGDKSGAIFPGSTGRSPGAQARAGPATANVPA